MSRSPANLRTGTWGPWDNLIASMRGRLTRSNFRMKASTSGRLPTRWASPGRLCTIMPWFLCRKPSFCASEKPTSNVLLIRFLRSRNFDGGTPDSINPFLLPQSPQAHKPDLPLVFCQYCLPREGDFPENPRLVSD